MKKKYLSYFLSVFFCVNCSNENSSSEIKSNSAPETVNPCDTQKTDDSECEWGGFKIKVSTRDIVKTAEKAGKDTVKATDKAGTDIDREVVRKPAKTVDTAGKDVDREVTRKAVDTVKDGIDVFKNIGGNIEKIVIQNMANAIAQDALFQKAAESGGWNVVSCGVFGELVTMAVASGYAAPVCTAASVPTAGTAMAGCISFIKYSGSAITMGSCATLCTLHRLKGCENG